MHCLEHMLLIMSLRVRAGESGNGVADDLAMLASEAHRYVPEDGEEPLAEMSAEWGRRYRHLIIKPAAQGET